MFIYFFSQIQLNKIRIHGLKDMNVKKPSRKREKELQEDLVKVIV